MKMNKVTKIKKEESLIDFIQPCGHYVVVEPERHERVTASGIVTSTERQADREDAAKVKGKLVAVGQNAWIQFSSIDNDGNIIAGKPWAKVGDDVYFKRHVADRIFDIDDEYDKNRKEYFLMADENILAVIDKRS